MEKTLINCYLFRSGFSFLHARYFLLFLPSSAALLQTAPYKGADCRTRKQDQKEEEKLLPEKEERKVSKLPSLASRLLKGLRILLQVNPRKKDGC